jgi:REP element-mobilizing transposase RayT
MDSVPIVDIISYCFNPNHFHLILKQNIDQGVAKFMHRFSTGVTNHFNERYHRTGSLFQGTFKAVHVSDNDYLLHLSAYVNLNDKIHGITGRHALLVRSSWSEYKNGFLSVCNKDIIMSQFQGPSDYCDFALEQSRISIESKFDKKECAAMGVEGDDYGKKLQHRK